uniref:Glycosyltransferase n=1 Tax=viral metagenome TaxID=1070528 RepID=A0A6M3IQD1_9ZZZZ
MNKDLTIIYCSSNMEEPEFEQRIRDNILKVSGGLPIISVTQKPIENFGINIVVGSNIGVSGFNFFRQSLIACENAKTRFVISAEADTLYPPDYFEYIPEKDDVCYRNNNLYVMAHKRAIFWKKEEGATHAQVINREYYINRLKKLFKGAPQWSPDEKNFPKERHRKVDVFEPSQIEYYQTKNPVFQFKTSDSMRHYTRSDRINRYEIPYWGDAKTIRDKYLYGK